METNNHSVKSTYKEFDAPWHGDSKIIIGIDIGTTFSGAAFTFLQKGVRQELCKVDQWPGQQSQCSDGKIPSIVYYDSQGKATLFGAEALTYEAEVDADEYGWQLVEHFKLHMHPKDLRTKYRLKFDDLPTGVSVEQVYSDFLKYMLRQIKPCFWRMYGSGPELWEKYRPDAVFVIAHPNGWGPLEQSRLRVAAVSAGLTTTNKAADHIRFVSEAEASVHFGLYYTNLKTCLHPQSNFVVCDAGGSTVDSTLYSVEEVYPRFEVGEVRGSACVQAGAIFVNEHLKVHLRRLFENTSIPQDEVEDRTSQGINNFESQEKRQFSEQSVHGRVHLRVGDSRYKVPSLGIKFGRLPLAGTVVRSFFDICVNDILASVSGLTAFTRVSYVLLVGGFAGNPYLRQRLQAQVNLIHQQPVAK